MRAESKYKVGDKVVIAGKRGIDSCVFGVVDDMYDYCGETATIEEVYWSTAYYAYGYFLDIDDHDYSWCENCFDPAERCPNLPEFTPGDIGQLI